MVALVLGAGPAVADHSLPPVRENGAGWVTWLLVAGGILAVGLAAWAFFAPEKPARPGPPEGLER